MVIKKHKSSSKSATKAAPVSKAITDTDFYKKKLETLQEDLLNIVRKKKEEVWPEEEVGDEADVAVRSLQRDLVFEQTGTERRLLEEVEAALRRIEKGTFGVCEANGERILVARLKVMPYARYCIKCQARFEQP